MASDKVYQRLASRVDAIRGFDTKETMSPEDSAWRGFHRKVAIAG